jgi:hypothetical protein
MAPIRQHRAASIHCWRLNVSVGLRYWMGSALPRLPRREFVCREPHAFNVFLSDLELVAGLLHDALAP